MSNLITRLVLDENMQNGNMRRVARHDRDDCAVCGRNRVISFKLNGVTGKKKLRFSAFIFSALIEVGLHLETPGPIQTLRRETAPEEVNSFSSILEIRTAASPACRLLLRAETKQ